MPGFQVVLTKGGGIVVPVPAGWTVTTAPAAPYNGGIIAGEIVLEGPTDPTKTHRKTAYRIKTEEAQVTLRYDDATGELLEKCRVRRRGQLRYYDRTLRDMATKPGAIGTSSKTDWVLRALAQNGRGL